MKRSKLQNKANRTKLQDDITKYKKQRNSKLRYTDNTETSKNLKPFWNDCKPYFSNKHADGESKIIIIENEKMTKMGCANSQFTIQRFAIQRCTIHA